MGIFQLHMNQHFLRNIACPSPWINTKIRCVQYSPKSIHSFHRLALWSVHSRFSLNSKSTLCIYCNLHLLTKILYCANSNKNKKQPLLWYTFIYSQTIVWQKDLHSYFSTLYCKVWYQIWYLKFNHRERRSHSLKTGACLNFTNR